MILKLTDRGKRTAFSPNPKYVRQFRELWRDELGHLFECPRDEQLTTWLVMAGCDFQIVRESVADLLDRAQWKTPLNPDDQWGHAIAHFSARLIHKTKSRYGRVRPTQQREAA